MKKETKTYREFKREMDAFLFDFKDRKPETVYKFLNLISYALDQLGIPEIDFLYEVRGLSPTEDGFLEKLEDLKFKRKLGHFVEILSSGLREALKDSPERLTPEGDLIEYWETL